MFAGFFLKILESGAVNFLKKYWREAIIVILVLGVWWYHHSRTVQIENLQTQVVQLEKDNTACKTALNMQNSVIDAQNKKSQQAIADTQKKAQEEAAKKQKEYETAINKLKNRPIAQTCTGAITELRDSATKGDMSWSKK